MKRFLFTLLVFLSFGCQAETLTGTFQVIPQPKQVAENADHVFLLSPDTKITYPEGNAKMKRNAEFLSSYIQKLTQQKLSLTTQESAHAIELTLSHTVENSEGYEIHVSESQVLVKAQTEAGIFYAIQTLQKAIPILSSPADVAALPMALVKDFPNYGYRGYLIDVGRHFFSVEYLKEVIDMLALHNINYFHWHLTEDQGWRIEIKKYPKLITVGSHRKETLKVRGGNEYDGIPVDGYYTQEEAKEIVAYAAERFITVIPEVDLPGHMLAALASYPELGCTGGPYEVATRFGVFEDVLCGGSKKALKFAKDVLNEIMDIFPSPYIHIGGDECPKEHWEKCPVCQAKIKKLGIVATEKFSAENQLQQWFMGQLEQLIQQRGRTMMGWDEILEGNPSPSAIVMAWTSPQARIEAVKAGHQTIVTPITHLYFSNPNFNRIRGAESVARVYNFTPEVPAETGKGSIIGVQGCIWTEWVKDSTKLEWEMIPRISALSELQWADPKTKDFKAYLKKLPHQMALYKRYGFNYKEDIEQVTVETQPILETEQLVLIKLSTYDDAPIYYTLNGTEPSEKSNRYTEPFMGDVTKLKVIALRK